MRDLIIHFCKECGRNIENKECIVSSNSIWHNGTAQAYCILCQHIAYYASILHTMLAYYILCQHITYYASILYTMLAYHILCSLYSITLPCFIYFYTNLWHEIKSSLWCGAQYPRDGPNQLESKISLCSQFLYSLRHPVFRNVIQSY